MSGAAVLGIDAQGVRLHVETRGRGSPVVLLHGFTGSTESIRDVAEALAARHRAISIDLVGHGRSDAPGEAGAYTMSRCVEQLRAVLDALGLPRVHLLGYSMGGRSALALAATHPERVASAVLVGASAGIADPAARAARRRDDEALAERIERDGLEAFVEHWLARPLFASQGRRLPPAARAAARAQRLANRTHGLANSLRGMGTGAQPPLHARLPAVDAPVCLVVGEEDAKFLAIAGDLARRLPRARVRRIPRAGHAAHLENPSDFLRVVERFLAPIDAKPMRQPGAARPAPQAREAPR